MSLNADLHQFLLQLERAQADGGEWVSVADVAAIPSMQREIAVRTGWVKQKSFGNLAQYKITAAGYSALGDNAETMIHQLRADNVQPLDAPDTRAHIRSLIQPVGEPVVFNAQIVEPVPPEAEAALEALVTIFGDDEAAAPVDPEISVSVYSESLGTDAPAVETCKHPGCDQPRHGNRKFCKRHCQEADRARNQKYASTAKARRQAVTQKSPATQPSVATVVIDEQPFTDEDTQPDIIPVVETSPLSIHGEGPGVRFMTRLLIHSAVRSFTLARRVARGLR